MKIPPDAICHAHLIMDCTMCTVTNIQGPDWLDLEFEKLGAQVAELLLDSIAGINRKSEMSQVWEDAKQNIREHVPEYAQEGVLMTNNEWSRETSKPLEGARIVPKQTPCFFCKTNTMHMEQQHEESLKDEQPEADSESELSDKIASSHRRFILDAADSLITMDKSNRDYVLACLAVHEETIIATITQHDQARDTQKLAAVLAGRPDNEIPSGGEAEFDETKLFDAYGIGFNEAIDQYDTVVRAVLGKDGDDLH